MNKEVEIKTKILEFIEAAGDKISAINDIREFIFRVSPLNSQPVDFVKWVPVEQVEANDYNPNSVAVKEMSLLYTSILHDGFTQPCVTFWDAERSKYTVVDGYHRYFTCKTNKDILERNHGMIPIVVIDKPLNERMASTVRHNRARGKHSIAGMSSMVFEMLDNGWTDSRIIAELGMEAEELLKLKYITGFAKLFEDTEYKKAWKTRRQILLEKEAIEGND